MLLMVTISCVKASNIKLCWDPTSWTETATDCVASALLDPYAINPIASGTILTGNTLSQSADGLTFTLRQLVDNPPAGTPLDTRRLALSVADFNIFRKRVAFAIDALDDKITQILNVPRPSCWAAWTQYHQDYLIYTIRNLPTPSWLLSTYNCSKIRCTGKMAPPDENLVNAHSQHRQNFSSGPGTSNFWTLVNAMEQKFRSILLT